MVEVQSDASKTHWGAVLKQNGKELVIHDYWLDATHHINVLGACSLEQALYSPAPRIKNTILDVWSDIQAVVKSWNRQGDRSSQHFQAHQRLHETTV